MYDSIEEAELHLEADIVETSEFIGYDAAERPLRIDTEGERVVITAGEPSSAHRERLETLLRKCLEAMGWIPPRPMGYSLPELIKSVCRQAYRTATKRGALPRSSLVISSADAEGATPPSILNWAFTG